MIIRRYCERRSGGHLADFTRARPPSAVSDQHGGTDERLAAKNLHRFARSTHPKQTSALRLLGSSRFKITVVPARRVEEWPGDTNFLLLAQRLLGAREPNFDWICS